MQNYKLIKNKARNPACMTRALLPRNCSGQTGETITWLVATLIVVGILIIFIYASVLLSNLKTVGIGDLNTDLEKESIVLNEKTFLAEQINGNNKEMINSILKQENSR